MTITSTVAAGCPHLGGCRLKRAVKCIRLLRAGTIEAANNYLKNDLLLGLQQNVEFASLGGNTVGSGCASDARVPPHTIQPQVRQGYGIALHVGFQVLPFAIPLVASHLEEIGKVGVELESDLDGDRRETVA